MIAVTGTSLEVDGIISGQDAVMQTWCPGIVGGWEWVPYYQATGSPTITCMHKWLGNKATDGKFSPTDIAALQKHYGVSVDGLARRSVPDHQGFCRTKSTSGLGKLTNPQAAPSTGC